MTLVIHKRNKDYYVLRDPNTNNTWLFNIVEIKEDQTLEIFTGNIKAIPHDCSCKLWKSLIIN